MRINHSNCDHPKTPKARQICRDWHRAHGSNSTPAPLVEKVRGRAVLDVHTIEDVRDLIKIRKDSVTMFVEYRTGDHLGGGEFVTDETSTVCIRVGGAFIEEKNGYRHAWILGYVGYEETTINENRIVSMELA